MRVKLTREQKIHALNSRDISAIMKQILLSENVTDGGKEHLWVVSLSNSNRILLIEQVGEDTGKKKALAPTDVFGFALQKQAAKIVLVQNHRSGALEPSKSDEKFTEYMYRVGLFLKVPVIDHLIVGDNGYYSFFESGLLPAASMTNVFKYGPERQRVKKPGKKKVKK